MNLPKNIKILIAALAILIMLLFLIVIFLPRREAAPSADLQPKPIPSPSTQSDIIIYPTTSPVLQTTRPSKIELTNLLPVRTDEFNIEYLSLGETILVTIKKAPIEESRLSSERWFRERGVTNYKEYNIQWIVTPDLRERPLYN